MKPPELSSLSTGIVDKNVNCDEAFEIETIALKQIEGKKIERDSSKEKVCREVSFATITKAVTIRNDTVCVNPVTLLHCMVCTVRTDEQLSEIFKYELCAYPPSLFDKSGLMRKDGKASIAKVFKPAAH